MNFILSDSKIVSDGHLTDCSFNIVSCRNIVVNNPPLVLESSSPETTVAATPAFLEIQNTNTTANNLEKIAFLNSEDAEVATISGVNVSHITGEGKMIFSVNNSSGNLIDCASINTNYSTSSVGNCIKCSSSNISATYTVLPSDNFIGINDSSGGFTITLPAIASLQNGWNCIFKKVNASVNTTTIAAPGGSSIDLVPTILLTAELTCINVLYYFNNFYITGSYNFV